MYNLDENAIKDFPWTKIVYNKVEPWRNKETSWFEGLPVGWGDVIYKYLIKMDKILKKYNLMDCLLIEQVKEKWGLLRWYYSFYPVGYWDEKKEESDFSEQQLKGIKIFDQLVYELEEDTEKVCCDCGTAENVECYGGWVHFACPECESKRKKKWQEVLEEYKKVRKE